MVRMRACPKHASERSLYYIGLSKGLSVAGWLRHPGARPSARSQRRAILAPGCARKPGGRTSVLSARRVPRLASRIARQLAFLRKPMTAHGVPLPRRGLGDALCRKEEPSSRARATARCRRCKGCARSGRHAECPVEMDAARRPRPGGWTGVRRRGMRTMGCAISTGRRGAAAGARFQTGSTHRQMRHAPQPQKQTGYLFFFLLESDARA